jgi:3'-phosphoadenosine 5'-phosphosulfate sulfotransferase (PAPS reductase)/FAD synthetase
VHINTGIGIEETRQFVRDTCKEQGWPLIELYPDGKTYRQLVLEKGFPRGPKSHNSMYYWLKQRQVRRLVREHKTHRRDRIGLVTGIRLQESQRRMTAALSVPVRREGSQVWLSPILDWSALQCNEFISEKKMARNQVVDLLHRSGECLCGALAQNKELKEIKLWYPKAAGEIEKLQDECALRGLKWSRWATTAAKQPDPNQNTLPLCVGCANENHG